MPRIVITNECHDAILGKAELPFKETGIRLPDGTWSVPLSWHVINALRAHQMLGETLSDVILRVISIEKGPN